MKKIFNWLFVAFVIIGLLIIGFGLGILTGILIIK